MKSNYARCEDPWIAEIYDHQVAQTWANRDIDFYTSLAKESDGPALELGCGTGRVLFALARADKEVMGLDISTHMLTVARRKLDKECPHVQRRTMLVHGDMTSFSVNKEFGLIVVPYRAFQTLLESADQKSCLESCARHLLPEGQLAINVFNPKQDRLAMAEGADEPRIDFSGPYGLSIARSGHTKYDPPNRRLSTQMRYESTSRTGQVTTREYPLELCYFFRGDVESLLEACGFGVEALYGDFDRSPLGPDSPEMIFVAKKK